MCDELGACLPICLSVFLPSLCLSQSQSVTITRETIPTAVLVMTIKVRTLIVPVNLTSVTTVRTMVTPEGMIWRWRGVGRSGDVSLRVSRGRHVVMYFEVSCAMCPLPRKICNLSTEVVSLKFEIRVWNLGVKRTAPLSRPYLSCSEQTLSSLGSQMFLCFWHGVCTWSGSVSALYP